MVAEGSGWGCEFDMNHQGGYSEDMESTVEGGRISESRLSVWEVWWRR